MARKFLYFVAGLIVVAIVAGFALTIWSRELTQLAFVPGDAFEPQEALADNAYGDPAMWISRPGLGTGDPARWQPALQGDTARQRPPAAPDYAVFFVHPTSYIERARWNAPLDDAQSQQVARTYVRGMASPFNTASEIWAPRYRQATLGAFLDDGDDAERAIDAAYADVRQAFAYFLDSIEPDTPIVLVGHSQGARHLLTLLRGMQGSPVADRIAAAYVVGWPISVAHDLPALPLPACASAGQAGCILGWSSFAEPADPSDLFYAYARSTGFDGIARGDSEVLCVNPITGTAGGRAPATANRGTLVPRGDLTDGELVPAAVPARCDADGLLLIGDPPQMGSAVLPGNNYHVYDIPLFWANVQADAVRRVRSWTQRRS